MPFLENNSQAQIDRHQVANMTRPSRLPQYWPLSTRKTSRAGSRGFTCLRSLGFGRFDIKGADPNQRGGYDRIDAKPASPPHSPRLAFRTMSWPGLSGQDSALDKWSLCRL